MSPSLVKRGRAWGARAGRSARRRLPRPVWQEGIRTINGVRTATGRGPGRGHMLPDFVIIGAAKAGTTSLYGWLSEHPYVVPATTKEVHYFDYNVYRGVDWYRAHFPHQADCDAFAATHGRPFLTGEASPSYISHHWVPERLARRLPDAKLLVTLRDPVDRAYSQFQMSCREQEESLSFEEALAIEDERLEPERARIASDERYNSWPIGCWSYQMRSRYAEQLERWFSYFDRSQFHILTLEELAARPSETLDAVHAFLGLSPFTPENLKPLHAAAYNSLAPVTRARLQECFRPHNERLYELIGRDLGWETRAALPASKPAAERQL
jgi:hypothetical protein